MATTESKAKYWAGFFVSLGVMGALLAIYEYRPFFWTILPFVCTFFALAMDLIGDK